MAKAIFIIIFAFNFSHKGLEIAGDEIPEKVDYSVIYCSLLFSGVFFVLFLIDSG